MLANSVIEAVLAEAMSTGADFAEIFVESRKNNHLHLIGGKVEKSLSGEEFGVGIRVIKELFSVYAYTNDPSLANLTATAKKAASAVTGTGNNPNINLIKKGYETLHPVLIMPDTVSKKDKIDVMRLAYTSAKEYDSCISQVSVGYIDYTQKVLIANSDGLLTDDTRTRTRLMINSVASNGSEMQTGTFNPGASSGFEFYKSLDIPSIGREASRVAKTMLGAKPCPSGQMSVVIDNGFGGVIFHEACGHGLEASSVSKGMSVFAGKLGQSIASPVVTAIDDGTIPNGWGSLNVDDEGTPTRKNILIENGILKGYMIDKLNGKRMGMAATGSSRREGYKFAPTSRMTNTYIAEGSSSFNELISNTEKGLYAKYMGGGSVNPATGDFNFFVMEGYLIENGKITEPVRGATLIGNGPDTLTKIDMVGNNLAHAQGMCGAESGSIPANVGQPAVRVSSITVGGSI